MNQTLTSSSSDVVSTGHVARLAKTFCKKLSAFSRFIENFFGLNRADGFGKRNSFILGLMILG